MFIKKKKKLFKKLLFKLFIISYNCKLFLRNKNSTNNTKIIIKLISTFKNKIFQNCPRAEVFCIEFTSFQCHLFMLDSSTIHSQCAKCVRIYLHIVYIGGLQKYTQHWQHSSTKANTLYLTSTHLFHI